MGNRFITPNGELCLGKYLRIHLLLLPLGAAAYWGNYFGLFAVSWVSALCHETAHILAGKRLGVPIAGVSLLPFGVCARLSHPVIKIPSHEILMALAGPLSNLILAALFWVLGQQFPSDLAQYGTAANLAMFCLNLLPCLPLDGGRILRACLTLGSDALTAWRTTLRISRAVSVCLLAGAVLLLLTSQFNFSLILIGVFLLGNLCGEQKSISQQALREILYYKEKLEREQLNRTSILTAYADLPARRLLRRLSYHRYYTIQVVDDRQKVVNVLTESQILNALLHQSIRITLGEIG